MFVVVIRQLRKFAPSVRLYATGVITPDPKPKTRLQGELIAAGPLALPGVGAACVRLLFAYNATDGIRHRRL